MLAKARLDILAFSAVNECRVFGVKAMETVRLLVHICVILGYKLPSDFGGVDIGLGGRRDDS